MTSNREKLSDTLFEYLVAIGGRESQNLKNLRQETADHPYPFMQICPVVGQLLAMLVKLINAKLIIEIGSFTGYSALAMAEAMPDVGRLIACDHSEDWTAIATRHWQQAGVINKIDLRVADARQTAIDLNNELAPNSVDLVFVDADKAGYLTYYQTLLPLVRKGGLMIFDDVLYGERIFNDTDQKDSTRGIRAINEFLQQDDRIDLCMLPIDNGLTIVRKC